MVLLSFVLLLSTAYFVNKEYNDDRKGWLIFWAMLLGWNLHTLLGTL